MRLGHRLASSAAAVAAAVILSGCAAGTLPTQPERATPSSPATPSVAPSPVAFTFHIVIDDITFDSQGDTATASSPGLGDGSLRAQLFVDDTDPGPNGNCNTLSEYGTFTFKTGTIEYRSWHRDCNFTGARVQTILPVPGGRGGCAGATGWGTERDDAPDGFAFDGTIPLH